jgi:hypothetical protein
MFEFELQDYTEEEQKVRNKEILEICLQAQEKMDEKGQALKDALCELPGSDERKRKLKKFFNTYITAGWKGLTEDNKWAADELILTFMGPLDCIWIGCP